VFGPKEELGLNVPKETRPQVRTQKEMGQDWPQDKIGPGQVLNEVGSRLAPKEMGPRSVHNRELGPDRSKGEWVAIRTQRKFGPTQLQGKTGCGQDPKGVGSRPAPRQNGPRVRTQKELGPNQP